MSQAWPKVRLGEVLMQCDTSVPVSRLNEVNLAGVYSFGRGLFKRGPMHPSKTSYKSYNRLITDDFVISTPKAWEGALARVTSEFEGWYLSPVFPTFRVDQRRLLPGFLEWFCKRELVWSELQRKARGIGARRESVHPEKFLSLEIPLPTLSEQKLIVARIDELSAQIDAARNMQQRNIEEVNALMIAMAHREDLSIPAKERAGWKRKYLSEVMRLVDDSHAVATDRTYPNLGIYSFGRGLFEKPPINGLETSAKSLRRVKRGQFIYSRLFAFEGAYGMVTKEFDDFFVSNEYPTFECDTSLVKVEFLAAYFRHEHVWKNIAAGSKGIGDRRQRVQPDQVLKYALWLPPMKVQNRLTEMQMDVDFLKRLYTDANEELNTLLPAILDKAFKGNISCMHKHS